MQPSVQTPDLSSVGVGSRGRPERGRGLWDPVARASLQRLAEFAPTLSASHSKMGVLASHRHYLPRHQGPCRSSGQDKCKPDNGMGTWHGKAVHGHSSWSFRLSKTSIAILHEATYPRPSKACIVALMHLRTSRTGVLLVASQPVSGQFHFDAYYSLRTASWLERQLRQSAKWHYLRVDRAEHVDLIDSNEFNLVATNPIRHEPWPTQIRT